MSAPSLDPLRELAVPAPPVSYFPQTWAWLVLLALVLGLALLWGAWRWRRWRRAGYRREALARLDRLARALDDRGGRLAALRELPTLLKRVALSMPDAPPVAALGGPAWQAFLAARAPAPLPADLAATLCAVAYGPDARLLAMPDAQVRALFATCRGWIEAHHVAA